MGKVKWLPHTCKIQAQDSKKFPDNRDSRPGQFGCHDSLYRRRKAVLHTCCHSEYDFSGISNCPFGSAKKHSPLSGKRFCIGIPETGSRKKSAQHQCCLADLFCAEDPVQDCWDPVSGLSYIILGCVFTWRSYDDSGGCFVDYFSSNALFKRK